MDLMNCAVSRKLIKAMICVVVLVAPCCGYFVITSLEERARVEAIPPADLPGHVLVYTAPN